MLLLVFYYFICAFLCCCHSFNLSLCRLSPFLLSYVNVSRPCRLSDLTLTGPLIKIFLRFWKISGKICSRCYELPRDLFRVFKEC